MKWNEPYPCGTPWWKYRLEKDEEEPMSDLSELVKVTLVIEREDKGQSAQSDNYSFSLGQVGILERLEVTFLEGEWKVTNPDGHPSWIGKHAYKNGAILEYLKARLGIQSEEEAL